jgi:hypothetical protein
MDPKKLSRWEVVGIIFCITIFVFLSLIVIFKSEWLDSVFYGPPVQEQEEENGLDSLIKEEEGGLDFLDPVSYAAIDIVSTEGKASVSLILEKEASITGLELFLQKDESVEVEDFVCNEPFDCMLFEVEGDEVSIVVVIPPTSVDVMTGEVLVGELLYSGSGNVYLNSLSKTFVSTVENPEVNILHSEEEVFFLE